MEHLQTVGVIVGDEIGQIKKINLLKGEVTPLTVAASEPLHYSKSITSISPLNLNGQKTSFLISNISRSLFYYDSQTDEIRQIDHSLDNLESSLIGSRCIDDQNVALGFKNGSIYKMNLSNVLYLNKLSPKALNLLGVESPTPAKRSKRTIHLNPSKNANNCEDKKNEVVKIYEPKWNEDTTYLTCFNVNKNRLAVGGFNAEMKIFDINTGQSIFSPKAKADNWFLPNREIWVSGLEWIDNEYDTDMIATCSRTQPYVRIFDLRQRKAIIEIDLTPFNNANNESNMPSLTTLCSTPSVTNFNGTSLIVGTTLGRMVAVDLRMQNHTSKVLGGFKDFSGGSIRDIKCVRNSKTSLKILSCSLDRFVRVHNLTKTNRLLDKKFYIKTKPTCLQPILARPETNKKSSTRDDKDEDDESHDDGGDHGEEDDDDDDDDNEQDEDGFY